MGSVFTFDPRPLPVLYEPGRPDRLQAGPTRPSSQDHCSVWTAINGLSFHGAAGRNSVEDRWGNGLLLVFFVVVVSLSTTPPSPPPTPPSSPRLWAAVGTVPAQHVLDKELLSYCESHVSGDFLYIYIFFLTLSFRLMRT